MTGVQTCALPILENYQKRTNMNPIHVEEEFSKNGLYEWIKDIKKNIEIPEKYTDGTEVSIEDIIACFIYRAYY